MLRGSKCLPGVSDSVLAGVTECLGRLDEVGPWSPHSASVGKGRNRLHFPNCLARQQLAAILCLSAVLVSLPQGMGCVFLSIPGVIFVMVSSLVSSLEYVMQKSHHCFMSQGLLSPESLHPPNPRSAGDKTHGFMVEPYIQPVSSPLNFPVFLVLFCARP